MKRTKLKNPSFRRILIQESILVFTLFSIVMAMILLAGIAMGVGGLIAIESFPPIKP